MYYSDKYALGYNTIIRRYFSEDSVHCFNHYLEDLALTL